MNNTFETKYVQALVTERNQKLDNWLKATILQFAQPKIKGEITKGKLCWRGIKLCIQDTFCHTKQYWVEQRGKQIGEIFKIYNRRLHIRKPN